MTPFVFSSPGGFARTGGVADLVVYLHGFRSSSKSVKAQKMIDAFDQAGLSSHLWVPDLPVSPAQALALINQHLDARLHSQPDLSLTFIGSSLGGYYATVLGELHVQASVVLLNPAIKPYDDLQDQIGKKKVYFSDEEIEFVPAYLGDLKAMEQTSLTDPQRYFLVAARDDEVLNCDTMLARYHGAHQLHLLGSDHALSDFDEILPFVKLAVGLP
ncbi:YqiA/YcfP family alpha/beta fold hydrolase [Limnobacter alexandrii]|uniref:YqiA/YcfP family alpha/beta fold hydrolase n=1 Tax=Limnobacter alexandrii TaxID=2570352 RepID=UPI001485D0F3|nr:YqiA/YcfP family alpha/beta fold hydrolase [Limnobacter alexandrii]